MKQSGYGIIIAKHNIIYRFGFFDKQLNTKLISLLDQFSNMI